MDRIWHWAWDRYAARYSWALWGITFPVVLQIYLVPSFVVVAFEDSSHYVEAVAVTIVAVLVVAYVMILPGLSQLRLAEKWAAGDEVDPTRALDATYTWARAAGPRAAGGNATLVALLLVAVGVIAGASGPRLVQYAILGAAFGTAVALIGVHSYIEAALRPARIAIAGDTGIGDCLPRSRPTFATWSNLSMLATAFSFAVAGAMLATVLEQARELPVLCVVIGCALTLGFAVPMTVGANLSPSLRPIRDLAAGTERVAAGDYSQRLPVVQDDDLGALDCVIQPHASRVWLSANGFRSRSAPTSTRPWRRGYSSRVMTSSPVNVAQVTVMFVDVRDFTPFAEANTAEDTVARLNALFEIVVPAIVDAGGHVNKFLGDGALAVFGAPNDLADHADAAVSMPLC